LLRVISINIGVPGFNFLIRGLCSWQQCFWKLWKDWSIL